MKKRVWAMILALALCAGLAVPACAVDVSSASQEDIRSTFTFLRNGTVDETGGVYTSSTQVSLGPYAKTSYAVYDDNDSWTITNTGSKAVSSNGSTDYTLSFGYCTYGFDPWSGVDYWGEIGGLGTLGFNDDGRPSFIYGGPVSNPVVLKAGESITIPASIFHGGPAEDSISEVLVRIHYGDEIEGESLYYWFYFGYDPAEKASIDQKLAGTDPAPSFTDIPAWCSAAVGWAVGEKITNGTSTTTFSPDVTCSHAEILTFLWRAAGKPTPEGKAPVATASYYQDAIDWAYGTGIVDDASFDPGAPCTRADAVTYIWLCFDAPASAAAAFTDVSASADCAAAVAWAVNSGITNGDGSETVFSPDKVCSRAQIVTFLHRAYVEEARLTAK